MWDDGDYHCEEDGEVITNGVINASNLCEGFEEDK